jgi:peptidoglycan/LPS O-acetylase OafA/YrhL
MNAWLNGTWALLVHFFVRETPAETYILIALCVLLGALALNHISSGLGALGAFYTTAILLTPAGLLLLVAALALPPVFGLNEFWMPLAMAGLALLIVVLPLTILFQKGGYVTALIAWTVTLLVVGAVLTLEPIARHSADKYIEKGMTIGQHRSETEKCK